MKATRITTPESNRAKIVQQFKDFQARTKAILLSPAFIDRVYQLKDRWQDESEFEQFADYVTEVRKAAGIATLTVTKAFTMTHAEGPFEYVAKFAASGKVTAESRGLVRFTA